MATSERFFLRSCDTENDAIPNPHSAFLKYSRTVPKGYAE